MNTTVPAQVRALVDAYAQANRCAVTDIVLHALSLLGNPDSRGRIVPNAASAHLELRTPSAAVYQSCLQAAEARGRAFLARKADVYQASRRESGGEE